VGGAVDLHSHTTASDGSLVPRELVRLAVSHGVRVLAITDHDSTDGLAEALDEARLHPPLQIVPGLEINCDVPGAEIHVLGYCVDWQASWFQAFLGEQRQERRQRVLEGIIESQYLGRHLGAHGARVVGILDVGIALEQVNHREVRCGSTVGH
jgi:predicted metal-dependent phosphoesterase TrpH